MLLDLARPHWKTFGIYPLFIDIYPKTFKTYIFSET